MEKILACMTYAPTSVWAGVHAVNLAKRIKAQLTFLLFTNDDAEKSTQDDKMSMILKIESMIAEVRTENVPVSYYQIEGDYVSELVNFVRQNKISLLVIASPGNDNMQDPDFKEFIEKLHHRLNCRIEVVQMNKFL